MTKNSYLKIIAKYFPKLKVTQAKLISHGYDHDVVIVNNKKVFRFPNESYKDHFRMETKVMNLITPKSPIPIPHYEFVSRDPDFGVYNFIKGKTMMPSTVKKMSKLKRNLLAKQLGRWISYLHSIKIAEAKKYGAMDCGVGLAYGDEFAVKLFESYKGELGKDFIERSKFPSKMHPIKQMIYLLTGKYQNHTIPSLMLQLERNMRRF